MIDITITIPRRPFTYPIHIGYRAFAECADKLNLDAYSQVICLVDIRVREKHEQYIRESLKRIDVMIDCPSGESNKHIGRVQSLWTKLLEQKADRKSVILNIGGGVMGDLGGFVASTYMRGIDFIQVPTTLLSMVDASVGGKTGINFESVKNLIGSFQQPRAVIVDSMFLASLPDEQIRSGSAEMFKHGLIKSLRHWEECGEFFHSKSEDRDYVSTCFLRLITDSIQIKKEVVTHDPYEKGVRKILNFGHTIGHAIESYSYQTERPLLHGEAVSIGMVGETMIAEEMGLAPSLIRPISDTLKRAGLPTRCERYPIDSILRLMRSDKKNREGSILFSLISDIGKSVWDVAVDESLIRRVLMRISTL